MLLQCTAWGRFSLHSALVAIVAFCMARPLHCTPEATCTAASPLPLITRPLAYLPQVQAGGGRGEAEGIRGGAAAQGGGGSKRRLSRQGKESGACGRVRHSAPLPCLVSLIDCPRVHSLSFDTLAGALPVLRSLKTCCISAPDGLVSRLSLEA